MLKTKTILGLIPLLLLGIFLFKYHKISFDQTAAKGGMVDIPTCEADSSGNIDQTINVTKGSTNGYDWAESTGCVSRAILETWAVTHNPSEMGVANLAKYSVSPVVPPPGGSAFLYRVSYSVQRFITINWTLDWLHQLVSGTLTDPSEVEINVTKYSGSSMISHFIATVHLIKIAPLVTLVTTHFELKTPATDENTVAQVAETIVQTLRTGSPYWQGLTSSHVVDFE